MVEISLNRKTNGLEISRYDGNSGKVFRGKLSSNQVPNHLNFFREDNNYAYIEGEISYEEGCKNTLIISPYHHNSIKGVKNAFISVLDSFIEISPIHNLEPVIDKSKFLLSGKQVHYNSPLSVIQREKLPQQGTDNIKKLIEEHYGIQINNVVPIPSKNGECGIYHLKRRDGEEYILKYRGKNKNRAELISTIVNLVPKFFSRNLTRRDSDDYTFEVDGNLYGVESFVKGDKKKRDLKYFKSLGVVICELHKNLRKVNQTINLDCLDKRRHNFLDESGIVSLYLDLFTNEPENHRKILSGLELLIKEGLSSKQNDLPNFLIHGDLNQSNIVWVNDSFKIIDVETMGVSKRVNELVPALILRGDYLRPDYIPGSLTDLIDSYNLVNDGELNLSLEEKKILPRLLNGFLIRYYVIRSIRKSIRDKDYRFQLEKDLNRINSGET